MNRTETRLAEASESSSKKSSNSSLTAKQRCGILHAACYMVCCKCILCKRSKNNEDNEVLPIEKSYLLLGCGACGKSTLLHRFATLDFTESIDTNSIPPTTGFSVKQIKYKHGLLSFWEVGGSERIRKYWPRYVEKELFDGLVYIVDASKITTNEGHMFESTNALQTFLKSVGKSTYQRWHRKPIYIILNKIDLRLSNDLSDKQLVDRCKSSFHFVSEYFQSCSFICTTCFASSCSISQQNDKKTIRKYKIKDIECNFEKILESLMI